MALGFDCILSCCSSRSFFACGCAPLRAGSAPKTQFLQLSRAVAAYSLFILTTPLQIYFAASLFVLRSFDRVSAGFAFLCVGFALFRAGFASKIQFLQLSRAVAAYFLFILALPFQIYFAASVLVLSTFDRVCAGLAPLAGFASKIQFLQLSRAVAAYFLFILALPVQIDFAALCDLVTMLRISGRCCADVSQVYWMSVVWNTSWRVGMSLCAPERMGGGRRRAFIAGLARDWHGCVHRQDWGLGTDESGRSWVIAGGG